MSDDFIIMANYSYASDEAGEDENVDGWAEMARGFVEAGCQVLEINLGCPNMSFNRQLTGDFDPNSPRSGASLGQIPEAVYAIVKATKAAVSVPVFVKLSPEGGQLGNVSKAAYEAGADAVSSNANRLAIPPIDIWNPKQSVYHLQEEVSMSCMSGPWIKPLALAGHLRDSQAQRRGRCRVIGHGGCETWQDAVEMAFMGADLIGICTAVLAHGFDIAEDAVRGRRCAIWSA